MGHLKKNFNFFGQSYFYLVSDLARHFSNQRGIYKVAKVVLRNW